MVTKCGHTSATTTAAGDGDTLSPKDLQRQGCDGQKGYGASVVECPSTFQQHSADIEHPKENHEDISRFRHEKVLFERPATEHDTASAVAVANRERETGRSRRPR